jgi:radical S-adenosyl methionine domain-containing protein 2
MPSPATVSLLIAIEGLDGTGKSTTVTALAERLGAKVVHNPPRSMADQRVHADRLEPPARRAWYLAANREAAKQAEAFRAQGQPVVMDRSVASTLAFGAAERNEPVGDWPVDIPQPDLLAVLHVADEERNRRLAGRPGQRTTEEHRLDADPSFRQHVLANYLALGGRIVDASGPVEQVVERIVRMCQTCPPDTRSPRHSPPGSEHSVEPDGPSGVVPISTIGSMTKPESVTRCPITTVNYHCWKPCNMHCRHCFARFTDAGHDNLPRAEMLAVIRELALGFQRINFVGGEPTLCPWLVDGLDLARALGLRTSLVTNGAKLIRDPSLRDQILSRVEWIGLSIDSADADTNRAIGRAIGKSVITPDELIAFASEVHRAGVQLKVNTVVQRHNVDEDLGQIVHRMRPERWKVLQVLPVLGQNDADYQQLAIDPGEFQRFLDRHRWLGSDGVTIVPEDHDAMTGSYAMVDPGGYAYDNVDGRYRYSAAPIHQLGWQAAFSQVTLMPERFVARGGNYSTVGGVR